MSAPAYLTADYAAALHALLPRGRAWPRDPDDDQARVYTALAAVYERSNARANQLLVDAFPATALELLVEWELTLGLPSRFGPPPTSIAERQTQVVAALTDNGGQSVAYFVALAARLGYAITITVFDRHTVRHDVTRPLAASAWAHAWRVDSAVLASDQRAALEGLLQRYKPAQTIVFFRYT